MALIGRNIQPYQRQAFIPFLNAIEAEMPACKDVHVILDNHATRNQRRVRAWLPRHLRWTFQFVPISCSWLNPAEGYFAKLTGRPITVSTVRSFNLLQYHVPIIQFLVERH